MLKLYESVIRAKNIPYFWNKQFNLIEYLKESTSTQIANTFKRMIDDIDKNLDEPFTIAKYFGKFFIITLTHVGWYGVLMGLLTHLIRDLIYSVAHDEPKNWGYTNVEEGKSINIFSYIISYILYRK